MVVVMAISMSQIPFHDQVLLHPDVIVALEGAFGTISEIAIAIKAETPVISLSCPQYDIFKTDPLFFPVETVTEAIQVIQEILRKKR